MRRHGCYQFENYFLESNVLNAGSNYFRLLHMEPLESNVQAVRKVRLARVRFHRPTADDERESE
jgi:hypothetical protein